MNSFNTVKSFSITLVLALALITSSCLNTSNGTNEDRVVFNFRLSGINNPIAAGNDTILVDSLAFLVGTTSLQKDMDDTLNFFTNTFQVGHNFSADETKLITAGTFNSDLVYNVFNFEIKKADNNDQNINDAFIEGSSPDQRFSMLISGSFNGNNFFFKSKRNYNFQFPLNTGSNLGDNIQYNVDLSADTESWFVNPDSAGLLNPSDTTNQTSINDNIENSVTLVN